MIGAVAKQRSFGELMLKILVSSAFFLLTIGLNAAAADRPGEASFRDLY